MQLTFFRFEFVWDYFGYYVALKESLHESSKVGNCTGSNVGNYMGSNVENYMGSNVEYYTDYYVLEEESRQIKNQICDYWTYLEKHDDFDQENLEENLEENFEEILEVIYEQLWELDSKMTIFDQVFFCV